MSPNYTIIRDLQEAEAMAKALVPYVHQEILYGSVGGGGMFSGGDMPRLTVGALLMRLRRLRVLSRQMDQAQIARLRKIEHRNEQVLSEWRSHYDQKMLREAHSRLDAMLPFFGECQKDPDFGVQVYKPEALRRTIAQELFAVIEEHKLDIDELVKKMQAIDFRLRQCVEKSQFLWDAILQPVYPEETFWWLYCHPILKK